MELRGRGWSILAAAREVGVSDHSQQLVARLQDVPPWPGGGVRADAGATGRATDQLKVRVAGGTDRDRRPSHAGLSIRARAAAAAGGFDFSRALHRHSAGDGGYRPFEAHRRATTRRARGRRRRIDTDAEPRRLVATLLDQRWSPQQISRELRARFPGQARRWLCHESIYQAIYQPGSALMRLVDLAPSGIRTRITSSFRHIPDVTNVHIRRASSRASGTTHEGHQLPGSAALRQPLAQDPVFAQESRLIEVLVEPKLAHSELVLRPCICQTLRLASTWLNFQTGALGIVGDDQSIG
jgi:hypothetical protein